MTDPQRPRGKKPYPSAREGTRSAALAVETPQTRSPSYRLAFSDEEFLLREELRPVRLHLELLKPELIQQEHGITSTVVMFGGARILERTAAEKRLETARRLAEEEPDDPQLAQAVVIAENLLAKARYYEEARELARRITTECRGDGPCDAVVITGGGPGIMEAANRGAADAGGPSIGLNIVLPFEQAPNVYVTPELAFNFHYFAVRKMHFLIRARVLIAFPGGFGTLDELFESLTLIQTKKIEPLPVLLFGRSFWERIVDFEALVAEGTISPQDLRLFTYVETADEAWEIVADALRSEE